MITNEIFLTAFTAMQNKYFMKKSSAGIPRYSQTFCLQIGIIGQKTTFSN